MLASMKGQKGQEILLVTRYRWTKMNSSTSTETLLLFLFHWDLIWSFTTGISNSGDHTKVLAPVRYSVRHKIMYLLKVETRSGTGTWATNQLVYGSKILKDCRKSITFRHEFIPFWHKFMHQVVATIFHAKQWRKTPRHVFSRAGQRVECHLC